MACLQHSLLQISMQRLLSNLMELISILLEHSVMLPTKINPILLHLHKRSHPVAFHSPVVSTITLVGSPMLVPSRVQLTLLPPEQSPVPHSMQLHLSKLMVPSELTLPAIYPISELSPQVRLLPLVPLPSMALQQISRLVPMKILPSRQTAQVKL